MGKCTPNWECLVVRRKQGLFFSVSVDDIKMAGQVEEIDHMGCTQRECKPNDIIIEEYTKMFESHISAGATDK